MSHISTFMQKTGIPIPDNTTPDSPFATKVKRLLVEELELLPEAVTNEAELRRDLDMYDLERLDFLVAWMNAFGIMERWDFRCPKRHFCRCSSFYFHNYLTHRVWRE